MDCKEIQKYISAYLKDELSGKKTLRFLNHVENCPECMEELSIQYLVQEGTIRLEEGSSFDLNQELKNKLVQSREDVKRRRKYNLVLYSVEAVAILSVVFILVLVVLYK